MGKEIGGDERGKKVRKKENLMQIFFFSSSVLIHDEMRSMAMGGIGGMAEKKFHASPKALFQLE